MNDLISKLEIKLLQSLKNNYSRENYDEIRFGEYPTLKYRTNLFIKIKNLIKRVIGYDKKQVLKIQNKYFDKYSDNLQIFFDLLNPGDRNLLIDLIAFRILGFQKVKLPSNNKIYWEKLKLAKSLLNKNDTYPFHFFDSNLQKCDLKNNGFNIQLYSNALCISTDFFIEQYAYKIEDKNIVFVEKGDIVFDIGACWGDTSLYFAFKTGENGKVFCFEFIPENIKIFNLNISLNHNFIKQIELIQNPVSDESGIQVFFKDNGPGSKIELEAFVDQTGITKTISIDDFVINNNIKKVDFIKMDIEGAESKALKGAIETIKKFKPKLAIAIYHSFDDFVNIPKWIYDLNLGYKLYLGHYTIHAEETIIFAKVAYE